MQILYYYTQCNVVSVWWMLVREGGDFLEIYPLLDGGLHPDQMNFDKNAPYPPLPSNARRQLFLAPVIASKSDVKFVQTVHLLL